jgi:hypothetical protein
MTSDTFAGIRPDDVPLFVMAQFFLGGIAATLLFRWLVPNLDKRSKDILLSHEATPGLRAASTKELHER